MQVQQQGQSTGTHSIKGTHPFNLTPVKSLCFSVQLHISCYCVYCKYIDLLECNQLYRLRFAHQFLAQMLEAKVS